MYAQHLLRPTVALLLGYEESTNYMGQRSFILGPLDFNVTSYIFILLSCVWAAQNSIEVDAETKESTRKTEEKLDGRNKEGRERKNPKRRPVGR